MLFITCLSLLLFGTNVGGSSWNTSEEILPWESYLQLGDIQRPLGLELNRSSIAHRHFYIGYLCLQSFMYDEAQEAFDLALDDNSTLIEAYIGKMLGCKHALWGYTNTTCGQAVYNSTMDMLETFNVTLSDLQDSLLSTVYLWYEDPLNITQGEWDFLDSIANLSKTYSNETDLQVLYGLSLLNVARQVQFQTTMEPEKMHESRDALKAVLKNEPNHPGALHYLIHAYDVANVEIAEQAREYALLYGKIVRTSSHAQHMPAHIWMRTGSWNLARSADETGIIVSFVLCATKLLNENVSISSADLNSTLHLLNITQDALLLKCDAENRAHSTEWLAYSRLQTGNWKGSVDLLRDLFIAENQSILTPKHYLPFAYRTQARTIVDLFFWFPYNDRFLNKTQQLLTLNGTRTIDPLGDNTTRWYRIWSEAGIIFSECLRLLTITNTSDNMPRVHSYLDRLTVLANHSLPLNHYISISISMMIPQLHGIHYYMNESWQECLDELYNATELETALVLDANTPTLIFARSSELLALHLLLIYEKYLNQSGRMLSSNYTLNGTQVSIYEFPSRALNLYQKSNSSAPNRAINTLGTAQVQYQLHNYTEASRLYHQLLVQINSSNDTDGVFLAQVTNSIADIPSSCCSATMNKGLLLSLILTLCIFFKHQNLSH